MALHKVAVPVVARYELHERADRMDYRPCGHLSRDLDHDVGGWRSVRLGYGAHRRRGTRDRRPLTASAAPASGDLE